MTHIGPGARVVVTGGAGFVGHHLVRALVALGADVLVVDDLSGSAQGTLVPATRLEQLDISEDDITAPIALWRPSVLFHLAAQVSVPRSIHDPIRDLQVNALGTLRVLEASKTAGVRRVVFTSSGGAIYGETQSAATEASPPAPESYYGEHKLLAERYIRWSGMTHAIARPSNVYGPDQPAGGEGAVIAAFVSAVRESATLVIHGDGTQCRDFLHVADLVSALLLLGSHDESGIWNVSSGVTTSVIDLTGLLAQISGRRLEVTHADPRTGDIRESRLSSERLGKLGWSPRWALREGIREMMKMSRA